MAFIPSAAFKGGKLDAPNVLVTTEDTFFGGLIIPPGTQVKLFESRDSGFAAWREPGGRLRIRNDHSVRAL